MIPTDLRERALRMWCGLSHQLDTATVPLAGWVSASLAALVSLTLSACDAPQQSAGGGRGAGFVHQPANAALSESGTGAVPAGFVYTYTQEDLNEGYRPPANAVLSGAGGAGEAAPTTAYNPGNAAIATTLLPGPSYYQHPLVVLMPHTFSHCEPSGCTTFP